MRIRTLSLLVLLGLSASAVADLTTIVRAVEVTASNINVPTTPNGRLMFKPCAGECNRDFVAVQLTPATEFRVGKKVTDFLDFRKAFFNRDRSKDSYALVSYDTKANTATSVEIAN